MAEQNAHDDERDTADLAAVSRRIWLPLTRRALKRPLSS